ncbi:MAG: transcriptional regulator PpsR [Pseudomonadota bacterium]
MDVAESPEKDVLAFKSPKKFLADLDTTVTAQIIASAADVALLVEGGIIRDVALGNPELIAEGYDKTWRGKHWAETVTIESKAKINDLLKAVAPVAATPSKASAKTASKTTGAKSSAAKGAGGRGKNTVAKTSDQKAQLNEQKALWRQVNHASQRGIDVPIKYTVVGTNTDGRLIALGRDLRSVSAIQQRLVETHQNLEREYSRMRETEARYRLLFEATAEPVMVVSADGLRIEEVNPAARRLWGWTGKIPVGQRLDRFVPAGEQRQIDQLLREVLEKGRAQTKSILIGNDHHCVLIASAFRQDDAVRVIIRMVPKSTDAGPVEEESDPFEIARDLPDGLVVTSADLRIIAANAAFLKMASLTGHGQVEGEGLLSWLGRSSTELNVLVSTLKTHGAVRNFSTVLRDRFGVEDEVELSAVSAPDDGPVSYCFSVRSVARRMEAGPRLGEALPSTVEQVTGLVGRMPLRDIVRESTDLIEKLCIETALDIAGDNRVSAADILGLSRQGLYSKLKRFNIGD